MKLIKVWCVTGIFVLLAGCASLVSSTATQLAGNLSAAILNSDDPQTVADGAPAYLLLLDSFLREKANSPELLRSAATLYSAYATVFVIDNKRAQVMSQHALDYALQAICLENQNACNLRKMPFDQFQFLLETLGRNDVAAWYTLGTSWAGYTQAHAVDFAAVAELPRIKAIMERLIQLDAGWQHGGSHLYLGVFSTLLPPALGGKPDVGKIHFLKAIELSNGKNLMTKVLYAEKYARLIFDKVLHDKLLNQVVAANPKVENLTLMNTLAQQKAAELLKSSTDYF